MIFPLVHDFKAMFRPKVSFWFISDFRYSDIFHSLQVTEEETPGEKENRDFNPMCPKFNDHVVISMLSHGNLNIYMAVEDLQQAWLQEQISSLVISFRETVFP